MMRPPRRSRTTRSTLFAVVALAVGSGAVSAPAGATTSRNSSSATTQVSRLWTSRYHGPDAGVNVANSMAVDPVNHNVYVTGTRRTVDGGDDAATIAYSSSGTRLWGGFFDGLGHSLDVSYSV